MNRWTLMFLKKNIQLAGLLFYNTFDTIEIAMKKLVAIFFTGMGISFLGSLPLGTLNVAAMQIGIQESVRAAMLFSLGSLLVEMVYVRISLVGISWMMKRKTLMKWLDWITLAIVVALATGSFIAALQHNEAKNIMLDNNMNRFLLGAFMCAINPVQIPFWFGWSTVLFNKKVLLPQNSNYNSYIIGIGIGTFAGNCVFIFGGKFIAEKLNANQHILNWVIGGIFALTALIQLYKIFFAKHWTEKNKTES
jgi:threonine/homoserine/homoserine lactone efflux protein